MTEAHTIQVEGMTCTGCEQAIGRALDRLDGVEQVTADHTAGEVTVHHDPAAADTATIHDRIREAGYEVAAST